ncbi:domain of Kin17 curved DNA-binding protein-domain-containing protein [Amylostereum chailletii]|nr:domain of Kin17 curved DNA-binding protein-domain-containing protein [Amylostereum chailletii]
MQRRKRVQDALVFRIAPAPDARRRRARRTAHRRLFKLVPVRIRLPPLAQARSSPYLPPCKLSNISPFPAAARWGTKRVKANNVYQEYIQAKEHLHMNATRWVTLTEFIKHLGRTGVAHVDETEKGWFIAWIDNSPKALAKQEASLKKEHATVSDEQRERQLIEKQIERAAAEA